VKEEARSKKQEARSKKQEARSKKQEARKSMVSEFFRNLKSQISNCLS
jgi:vacuolar-type H+-ATPase subunit E/Vma4